MTRHRILVALFLLAAGTLGAWATNDTIGVTAGSGKLANLIKFVSTNVMSEAGICDATTENQCASVSAGGAVKVDNSAVTQPVSQATAASLNATVVGTGTFAVQAASTLNAETTKVIGTVRNVGNAGAITDFAGQNAASPANSWLIGGQFNTSPTTLTTGNASPLQLDNAGNLLVNIKAGAGSGGTALADEGAFTQGTTNTTVGGCLFTTSVTNLTTGQAGAARCTNDRQQMVSDSALLAAVQAALTSQGVQIPIGGIGIVPSANSGIAATTVPCGSAVSTCQLKNGAGNLYSAYSRSGTAGWLMVFNTTTTPTNGSTTAGIASGNMVDCIPAVQAQTGEYVASINYSPGPVEAFANGIYAAYSSTSCGTLTLSATAFLHGLIQ